MRTAWKAIVPVSIATVIVLGVGAWASELAATQKRAKSDRPPALFIVRQQLDAEITELDLQAGLVVVRSPAGKLKLDSPRLASTSLAKGDSVLLELGILPSTTYPPAASHTRDGKDPAIVRQRLPAVVTAVNIARGILKLQTGAGKLEVTLPSNVVEQFNKGNSVPIELALLSQPPGVVSAHREQARATRAGLAALLLSIFGKK